MFCRTRVPVRYPIEITSTHLTCVVVTSIIYSTDKSHTTSRLVDLLNLLFGKSQHVKPRGSTEGCRKMKLCCGFITYFVLYHGSAFGYEQARQAILGYNLMI
jgi:hypothetical protein